MFLWILMIVGSVLLDQVSKRLVVAFLMEKGSVDVIPNVLRFTYVENRGAAFGMLSEHRWIFMVVSTIAILAMLIYLWKFRPESKLACAAISLIVGGGIGNMIDRTLLQYVIDFIDFCLIDFAVFNGADSFVCVGAGLMILALVLEIIEESRNMKKAKEEGIAATAHKEDGEEL